MKTGQSHDDSEGVLVVGHGYLGARVAAAAKKDGKRVWATTRNTQRAENIASSQIEPVIFDWTDKRTLGRIPSAGQVLIAVSYDRTSRHSRYESQVGGLRNLLTVLRPDAKICYISTTGVYHQTDGPWVDEFSPARPSSAGGRAHLDAERLFHRARPGSPWTILRLAGIYGPNRVPRVADVIAGRPIRSPANSYLNLIHVDDAAAGVLASWRHACRRMYVVSDDLPVRRREFYREVARQSGVGEPTFESPVESPVQVANVPMRSTSNKRIWNRRFKNELVPKLRYPTYREGLSDVLCHFRDC